MAEKAKADGGVPTKIVVGTDGSPTAERAVAKATALARALGAELIIVSAYSSRAPSGVAAAGIALDSGWVAAAHTAAEATAKEAGEKARAAGVEKAAYQAVSGDPSEALIRVTEEETCGPPGGRVEGDAVDGPLPSRPDRQQGLAQGLLRSAHRRDQRVAAPPAAPVRSARG